MALYVDEVYISQMSGAGFLLYDMDRVEILQGPQGTLFGRNARAAWYITSPKSRPRNLMVTSWAQSVTMTSTRSRARSAAVMTWSRCVFRRL